MPEADRNWWPLARDPRFLESSQPGLFVAGDVRHGSIKRVASAVGEGATSIALVHSYLATLDGDRQWACGTTVAQLVERGGTAGAFDAIAIATATGRHGAAQMHGKRND
jgi:NADPH-dependent glutamate synthase beta subunit-like oxidoreductase